MMRPAIHLQDEGDAYYFIANYHSMTSLFDAGQRRKNSLDVALDFMACGLDPKKSVFWKQSDVAEVTELAWLLSTVTPMGLLERCHSYKDKKSRLAGDDLEKVNHGIFAYPVLMAADILAFDSNIVPVGRDQKQHVEVTRDIAIKFNNLYGETFVIPEPQILPEVAVVPGTDGQKMSKSYGNTIDIFGDEKTLRKRVMGIVMDSRTPQEPKPDADQNVAIQLLRLVAPSDAAQDFEERLRAGGLGYGELKKALFEYYWSYFATMRQKRGDLAENMDYVHQVLREGAERARSEAGRLVARAKSASGLN
jgi:tryptophanyl-tRNA synthetase